MRAYAIDRHGTSADLTPHDLPKPEVGAGEVLVRVVAAALNPADWKVVTGKDGGKWLHASKFPLVPGFDFSGVVEAAGAGVTELAVDDAVFGFLPYSRKTRQGAFGEYVSVPAASVAPKPAGASHVEAACSATVASTALQALRDKGRLKAGQRVLINGASGGVGGYAVQLAKHAGAEVWGTCSAAKAAYVEELGADRVIDYKKTAVAELDTTFDVILDAAATSSLGECAHILARGGTYVTTLPSLSTLTGFVRGLFTGRRARFVVVASRRDDLAELAKGMAEGWLTHTIDEVYPVDELPKALEHMHTGNPLGKLAVSLENGAS